MTPDPGLPGFGSSRVAKRSLMIAGHRTSISLEDAFWNLLKTAAANRNQSLASLVAEIDSARAHANLSSAIRIFVLEEVANGRLRTAADGRDGA